ncbi:ATP-binding cassette domain-containing protein [Virgibacillus sp. W0181]|uniref:ABC transporter ATP-binding protein n=1 Tax=Virgibacillus sp. W0181 TaxID=3391581 RepID=UPI003F45F47E
MVLSAKALTKTYHGEAAASDLSFSLEKRKCVALIGPNGAGKTTTLRMLAGLIKPTSGKIVFMEKAEDYRTLIGYLPQHPVYHEWMTGEEYLIYVARLSLMTRASAKKHAHILLRETGIFEAKDKRISAYSGGMKQRLGIAQAMIHRPKLLLLDEPVSALDPVGRREILTLIEQLKKKMTILFSTHILADADEVSDELLLLRKGELVEAGPMSLLRQKYKSSKIELCFTKDNGSISKKLLELGSVTDVTKVRSVYHVTVTNINEARTEILQTALEKDWSLSTFHINQASLEDMFMKVVES